MYIYYICGVMNRIKFSNLATERFRSELNFMFTGKLWAGGKDVLDYIKWKGNPKNGAFE